MGPLSSLDSALTGMSVSALAAACSREVDNYRHGMAYNDRYCLEIFRRALLLRDQLAWELIQQRFGDTVRNWLRRHPKRDIACRFESEENYVAQAFERFWQATAHYQQLEFRSLAAALRYLRLCLNGTILDTLRAYSRPQEVPLPEPGSTGEPLVEDSYDSSELWEVVKSMLSSMREVRVAYLLFHCGLKPREIVLHCPQEFGDVQEVYRLRRNIIERLLRNTDKIRWRLNSGQTQLG